MQVPVDLRMKVATAASILLVACSVSRSRLIIPPADVASWPLSAARSNIAKSSPETPAPNRSAAIIVAGLPPAPSPSTSKSISSPALNAPAPTVRSSSIAITSNMPGTCDS